MTQRFGAALGRGLSALPDALTAAFFAALWLAPLAFGAHAVRNALLLMLVEFVLVHSTGFTGQIAFDDARPAAKRLAALAGFALFYSLFIAAFALAFQAWWPLFAFAWLLLGKAALVLGPPPAARRGELQANWILSVVAYVGGVFLTILLPLPRLGLTEAVQPALELPGSGLWVEQPHRVLAFGVFYFGVLAWSKARGWAAAAGAVARPR